MKTAKFLIVLTVLQFKCDFVNTRSLVSSAINGILLEYFKNSAKVDLINYGISYTLVDGILRNKPETVSVQVLKGGTNFPWNNQLNITSIVVFDSPQNFRESIKKIKWLSNPRMRHKHLVHAPNLSVGDVVENIRDGFNIDQVNFLMNETGKSIELVTSFMFTSKKCRSNQLVTINRFIRNTMRWENSNFYPKKYQNLHGCVLTKALFNYIDNHDILTKAISKSYNFNTEFTLVETSLTATINQTEYDLIEAKEDFEGDKEYVTSDVFYSLTTHYTIPPGEPYTDLEKMFLMFDPAVWIAIAATFLIGFITIQIINLMSVKVQRFVFGRNIRTPTLNLLNIFLCGGQFKIPGRNFARFFLMLFIIWSLIIRTCYQSTLFKLLQADARKPEIKTYTELYEKGFTFYSPVPDKDPQQERKQVFWSSILINF